MQGSNYILTRGLIAKAQTLEDQIERKGNGVVLGGDCSLVFFLCNGSAIKGRDVLSVECSAPRHYCRPLQTPISLWPYKSWVKGNLRGDLGGLKRGRKIRKKKTEEQRKTGDREQGRRQNRETERLGTKEKNRARQREETQQNRERKYTEKNRENANKETQKTNTNIIIFNRPLQNKEKGRIRRQKQKKHRGGITEGGKHRTEREKKSGKQKEESRRRNRGEEARLTSQSFAIVSIASSRPGKSFFFSHHFGKVVFTLCK
jgi:hypothetical protein